MIRELKIIRSRRDSLRAFALDAFRAWQKEPKSAALLDQYRSAYMEYRDADEELFLLEAANAR